jgi:hypothetical protein
MSLVVCDKRGLSLHCRICSHSVAHLPKKKNGGPFTCDGGEQCTAKVAAAVNGIFGGLEVVDGSGVVGEVKCVPVLELTENAALMTLLQRVEVAFGKVLDKGPKPVSWQEKLTDVRWAEGRLKEIRAVLGKV